MIFTPEPNFYDMERLKKLMLGVQYVYCMAVEGDIAEFGTMGGMTTILLANAMKMCDVQWAVNVKAEHAKEKELHLFDSFQGLPDALNIPVDKDAIHVRSKLWAQGACSGMSSQRLFSECAKALPPHRIRMFEGWYTDTMKTVPEGTKYALLHLDCDLYSSTCDVLHPAFSKKMIAEGAILFFDDWNCNRASPNFGQRRAWRECVEKYRIRCSDEGEYGMASHKFIIHGYES